MDNFNDNHKPILEKPSIQAALDAINAKVNGVGFQYWIGEMQEAGYGEQTVPTGVLLILGHYDHAYAHIFELVFYGVKAHTVVDHVWHDQRDQFYLVPEEEIEKARQQLQQPETEGYHIFGIRHNHNHQKIIGMPMYVMAKGCSYCFF